MLTLSYFHRVSADDLRVLLRHLIEIEHVEVTEAGGLIVGLAGERITNSFKFYAVFQENEEFTVRCESSELGTIVNPPPAGERIAIAGHCWLVEEVDWKRRLVYCTQIKGRVPAYFGDCAGDIDTRMGHCWLVEEVDWKRRLVYCTQIKGRVPAYFGDCAGDIDTRILERMKRVLEEDGAYPYLMGNARARLMQARHVASNAGIVRKGAPHSGTDASGSAGASFASGECPLINLGGDTWALFPWLGSYAFLALERLLKIKCAKELGLKGLDPSRP